MTIPPEHIRAISQPKTPHEKAIVGMLLAWQQYAEAHENRYASRIGDDGLLGEHWAVIGRGLLGLLDGQTDRLDCGTVDADIRAHLAEEGFAD